MIILQSHHFNLMIAGDLNHNTVQSASSGVATGSVVDGTSGLELFARLISELNSSTKTNDKLQSLVDYFAIAPDHDKVWVIAIFSGRKPRRIVSSGLLREWCADITNFPGWLLDECYHTVGDLGETLALLLPKTKRPENLSQNLSYYLETFITIEKQHESVRKKFILESWQQMSPDERFVFNKLITGSFRIGVSQKMIVNALTKPLIYLHQ